MSDLEKIMIYLIGKAGPITKTKLVKLLYLIDVAYKKSHQKILTGLKYVKYFYGPYSRDIDEALKNLYASNLISYEEHFTADGRRYYLISLKDDVKIPDVDGDVEGVIDKVVKKYAFKRLDDILDVIYSMDEVKGAKFGEPIRI